MSKALKRICLTLMMITPLVEQTSVTNDRTSSDFTYQHQGFH